MERCQECIPAYSRKRSRRAETYLDCRRSFESIVGKATGTATDKLGSVRGWSFANKLDCVDDAVNTGTYLYMLRKDGLIRYHEVREPARRGFVINGKWPHVAVAIVERETGSIYVVDSWFLDNGYPAYVVSFEEWVAGWKPGIAASEGMSDNAEALKEGG